MKPETQVRIIDRGSVEQIRPHWACLFQNALDGNVFYHPDFVLCAMSADPAKQRLSFLTIWDTSRDQSEESSLIGLLPITYPVTGLRMLAHGWRYMFAVAGHPLVDASRAELAIEGLFHWLDRASDRTHGVMLSFVPMGCATASLITDRAAAQKRPVRLFSHFQRGVLRKNAGNFDSKRLRELRRLRRKLDGMGHVEFREASDGQALATALDAHLDIELRSWKGAIGTAIASDPKSESFARAMVSRLSSMGLCRIDQLWLNEEPISSVILLGNETRTCYWKSTFDARYGAVSPGNQLEFMIAQRQLADEKVLLTDSCEAPGIVGGLGSLWGTTDSIADVFIGSKSTPSAMAALSVEMTRRATNRLKNFRRKSGKATALARMGS